eukprot:3308958-Alexandrium_andersonii.AAC.1
MLGGVVDDFQVVEAASSIDPRPDAWLSAPLRHGLAVLQRAALKQRGIPERALEHALKPRAPANEPECALAAA